jgi:hypothetical protein
VTIHKKSCLLNKSKFKLDNDEGHAKASSRTNTNGNQKLEGWLDSFISLILTLTLLLFYFFLVLAKLGVNYLKAFLKTSNNKH